MSTEAKDRLATVIARRSNDIQHKLTKSPRRNSTAGESEPQANEKYSIFISCIISTEVISMGGILGGLFGGRRHEECSNENGSSLLFFFLLLVIIFCNCGMFDDDSLLFFFLLLVILFCNCGREENEHMSKC